LATIVYETLPVPAFEEYTVRVDAGAVVFGVEYRRLDEDTILAAYGPDARALFGNVVPAGMGAVVEEDGLSLHVFSAVSGDERLRFDCFDDAPHHHLLDPAASRNVVVEHDTDRLGPPFEWALDQLRTGLGSLLETAGAHDEAASLDAATVEHALERVERIARRMIEMGRPVTVAETGGWV
jgi:hypothetical protein